MLERWAVYRFTDWTAGKCYIPSVSCHIRLHWCVNSVIVPKGMAISSLKTKTVCIFIYYTPFTSVTLKLILILTKANLNPQLKFRAVIFRHTRSPHPFNMCSEVCPPHDYVGCNVIIWRKKKKKTSVNMHFGMLCPESVHEASGKHMTSCER